MWIITNNLQLSSGAPDTVGFISDLNEQSQICASSLMVRSKPSQPRIWSQKWKRDSWTQHLSGRILKPSHARSFATAWASLSPVIPVSHFQQPESGSEPKTLATSGRTSQEQLELFALDSASSRMSKATSPSDSAKSSETWEQSVTRRRGEYSLRVKSARLTSASGSSSWPSPIASEVRQGFQDRSRGMKGSQESLTTVVVKEATMWPTIRVKQAEDCPSERNRRSPSLDSMAKLHGQAAPANLSTLGSRQGLSEENWITPQSGDVTGSTQAAVDMWAQGQRPKTSDQRLRTQVAAMERRQELWPTITAHTPDMESNGPNGHSGTYLAGAVKQWATPRSGKTSDENPETWQKRADAGQVATMPLTAQVKMEDWPTVSSAGVTGGPTGLAGGSGNRAKMKRLMGGEMNSKLNPRWVETLMGLPVG